MNDHLPGAIVPFIPYPRPVEIPTSAPGDAPTICLQVNVQWLPYLLGCAKALIVDSTWASEDVAIVQSATSRANDLLDILASDTECSMITYRIDPSNPCIIQVSTDGVTWITFYDPTVCAPDLSRFLVDNPGQTVNGIQARENNIILTAGHNALTVGDRVKINAHGDLQLPLDTFVNFAEATDRGTFLLYNDNTGVDDMPIVGIRRANGFYDWLPLKGANGANGTNARPLNAVILLNMLDPGSAASASVAHLSDGTDQITENIPRAANGANGTNGDSGLLLPVLNNQIDPIAGTQSVTYNAVAKQLTANLFKPPPPQTPKTPPAGQDANCLLAANIAEGFKEATLAGANTAQNGGSVLAISASVIAFLLLGAVAEGVSGGAATPILIAIAAGIFNAGGGIIASTVTDSSIHALQQDIFCAIGSTHLIDQSAIDKAKAAIGNDAAIAVPLRAIWQNMLDAKGVRGLNDYGQSGILASASCDDCPLQGYDWQYQVNLRNSDYHAVYVNNGRFSPGVGIVTDPGTWLLRFHVPFTHPAGSCTITYAQMHVRTAEPQNDGTAYLYKGDEFVMLQDFNNPFATGDSIYSSADLSVPITHDHYIDCDISATQQPDGLQHVTYVEFTLAGTGLAPIFQP